MESSSVAAALPWLPGSLVITDASLTVIEYVGSEPTFGWSRDEVVGRRLAEDFVRRAPDDDGSAFLERIAAGEVARARLEVRCKGGGWRAVDVVALPLRDPSDALLGWLTMAQDPTRGAPLDALLAEHDTLSHVVDGANDATWDWRVASGVVRVNRRWLEMLGRTEGPLTSSFATWAELLHPDDIAPVREGLEAHLSGDSQTYEAEYRLRHADGRWVWVLDRGKVVERSADGTALRMSGAFTDITTRKHTEERLQATLAENEALVRELREALQRVHTLSGLVPICMHCKKVRDDAGYWARIEEYLSSHTGAAVTHGICPQCLQVHYPGFAE